MARSYAKQVAEGKRLVAAETDVKWALGDLALEIELDALDGFADEIGIDYPTLSKYRRNASQWAPKERRRGASWSVHDTLGPYEGAEKILDRLIKAGKATLTEARKAIGTSVESRTTPTPTSNAAVVKEMARTSARDLASTILKAGPAASDQVFHELRQQRAGVDTSPANRKAAEAKAGELGDAMVKYATHDLSCSGVAAVIDELNEKVAEAISKEQVSGRTLASIEQAAQRLYETAVAGKAFV
jgi:hypothetical protein